MLREMRKYTLISLVFKVRESFGNLSFSFYHKMLLLVDPIIYSGNFQQDLPLIKSIARQTAIRHIQMRSIYARTTGRTKEFVVQTYFNERGRYMTASEALNLGLIDRII